MTRIIRPVFLTCTLIIAICPGFSQQTARVTLSPAGDPLSPVLFAVADQDPTKEHLVRILASGQVLVRSDLTMDEATRAFWLAAGKTFTSLAPPPAPEPPPPIPCPPVERVEPERHRCLINDGFLVYLRDDARLCKLRLLEDIGKP